MDEQRRQIFQEELEEAVRQRDDLDTFIAVLAKRLGVEVPARGNGSTDSERGTVGIATGDPESAVAEGEFYGMSAPKASKALLGKFGRSRPMKTDEIFKAITKGGVALGSSGTLYRSLTRDPDFHKVGRGLWGLAEWYPNSAKRKSSESPDEDAPEQSEPDPEPAAAGVDDEAGDDMG